MPVKPRKPDYKKVYVRSETMALCASKLWADVVAHLSDNNLLTKTRLKTADRYARAQTEYEDLYPRAIAAGPVKEGPNGGDVFNFEWSALEKLNDRIGKFEDALLISPKAAADKIIPPKAASKPSDADEFV